MAKHALRYFHVAVCTYLLVASTTYALVYVNKETLFENPGPVTVAVHCVIIDGVFYILYCILFVLKRMHYC